MRTKKESVLLKLEAEGMMSSDLFELVFSAQTDDDIISLLEEHTVPFVEYWLLDDIPNELVLRAIGENPNVLKGIPPISLTDQMIDLAISVDGQTMKFVPAERQTNVRCVSAVESNSYAIAYIANKSLELCQLAYELNRDTFKHFPTEVQQEIQALEMQ